MILGVMGSQFPFLTWSNGVKGVVAVLLTAQLICVAFLGLTILLPASRTSASFQNYESVSLFALWRILAE